MNDKIIMSVSAVDGDKPGTTFPTEDISYFTFMLLKGFDSEPIAKISIHRMCPVKGNAAIHDEMIFEYFAEDIDKFIHDLTQLYSISRTCNLSGVGTI